MAFIRTFPLLFFAGVLLARAFREHIRITEEEAIHSNASAPQEGDGIQCGRGGYGLGTVCKGRENQYGTLLKVTTSPPLDPCACDSACIYPCPDEVVWEILFCGETTPVEVPKGVSGLASICKGEACACDDEVQKRDKAKDEELRKKKEEEKRKRRQEELLKEKAERERQRQLEARQTSRQDFLLAASKSGPGEFLELRGQAADYFAEGKPAPACVLIHGGNMLNQVVTKTDWLSKLGAARSTVLFYTSGQGAVDWGEGLWKKGGSTWPIFKGTFDGSLVQAFKSLCEAEPAAATETDSGAVGCCLINGAGGCACDDTVTSNQCSLKKGIGSSSWRFEGVGMKCKQSFADCWCQ